MGMEVEELQVVVAEHPLWPVLLRPVLLRPVLQGFCKTGLKAYLIWIDRLLHQNSILK